MLVCCAVVFVPCNLVVACLERADLLAVVFVVFCLFSKFVLVHSRIKGEVGTVKLVKPSSKYFTGRTKAILFCGSFMGFFCLVFAISSLYMCLVVTCLESGDLVGLVCGV